MVLRSCSYRSFAGIRNSLHMDTRYDGRKDIRVTIEGVERSAILTVDEIIDFATTFRGADEMDLAVDYARCWYD